jgi:exopolyphosphatase / guanosine-5'-triphosphate,3'-diphosphate pyrophosphatase
MIRIGIIDLGTNSVRFDVHEVTPQKNSLPKHRRLYREKVMVRLGQDVFIKGRLCEDAVRRTIDTLDSFAQTARDLHVDHMVAFGTSALRDATDSAAFLAEVKAKTGVEMSVMSGEEEARLIAKGILEHSKDLPKTGCYGLIDIGGGSAEVSVIVNQRIIGSASFNLGVARIQQVFLKGSPPKKTKRAPDPIEEVRLYCKSLVSTHAVAEGWPKPKFLLASSGTAMALARVISRSDTSNGQFVKKDLTRIVQEMSKKTVDQLLSMKGMDPKRVDLILAGGLLMEGFLSSLGSKEVRTTDFSLRDGILLQELERISKKRFRSADVDLDMIRARAKHWTKNENHSEAVCENAGKLFEATRALHKLSTSRKSILQAAALLHDAGETISPSQHAEHGAYIVKHAIFPSVTPEDQMLLTALVRWHRDEKVFQRKNIEIPNGTRRNEFLKLLSLLHIADALDRSHQSEVRIKAVSVKRNEVLIRLKSKRSPELEMLRVDQKKQLFEKVFGRTLKVAWR